MSRSTFGNDKVGIRRTYQNPMTERRDVMPKFIVTTTWSTGECFVYQFDNEADAKERLQTETRMYREHLLETYPYQYEIKSSPNKNTTTFIIHRQNTTECVMMSMATMHDENRMPLEHRVKKTNLLPLNLPPVNIKPTDGDSDHGDDNQKSLF